MIWITIKSTDHRGNEYTSRTQGYYDLESNEWLNADGEPVHGKVISKHDFSNMSFIDMVRTTSPYIPD